MSKEFKVVYSRGSGPGGQRKNKVETCVEITHIPTGMKERCQATPSRARNEKIAMDRLMARIVIEKDEMEAKTKNLMRIKSMSMGVIRTYNYKRGVVKDHRSGKEAPIRDVLDGKIDLLR